jgi:sterol desaturase/sphingolipid hydroxylase (fatty acid hydroxylase superfamily)
MALLVILGSLLAVALWEFCRPLCKPRFSAARRRCSNIGFWIANLLIVTILLPTPTAREPLAALLPTLLPPWPFADGGASCLVGFLLLDALYYAMHRCEHAVAPLWRLHALHHSDPDVDVTTALRHHPAEYLLCSAFYWSVAGFLGIPAAVVLIHGLAVFATAAVQHGNLRLPAPMEQSLQPLLMTTELHRIHHSIHDDEANANYGAVLSVWDRLFGTHRPGAGVALRENPRFGVRELPGRDCLGPVAMFSTPWRLRRAGSPEVRDLGRG